MSKFKSCIFFFLLLANPLFGKSVLIVGGGPAGLATGIEAKMGGHDVTILEKREEYSRDRVVFLIESSIALIEKWGVEVPEMHTVNLGEHGRIGVVEIRCLEQGFAKRALELGALIKQAEFKDLEDALPPYEILVGADGMHSQVREALGIELQQLGFGYGASTVIPLASNDQIEISDTIQLEDSFFRRFKLPGGSVIFMQDPHDGSVERLKEGMERLGWNDGEGEIAGDIPIYLQQVRAFSSEKDRAILVGDAAATASFFKGRGANTALLTAELAGQFLNEHLCYSTFDQRMKETTDAMIEDSRFLFR